jgi:hypothetical protein
MVDFASLYPPYILLFYGSYAPSFKPENEKWRRSNPLIPQIRCTKGFLMAS